MSVGDAIHLATAIVEGADHFYTRDGDGEKKKRKGGNIPLVGLPETSPGGKICGSYDLKVESPVASQGNLLATAGDDQSVQAGLPTDLPAVPERIAAEKPE